MILIRTHHKTGTVWMLRVFQGIADALNLRLCHLLTGFVPDADLYLASHAPFPSELTEGSFRGLHLIRDPRDVILSGMHYHRKSAEEWLHIPRSDLGGLTYQENLNSLDDDERLYFEMREAGYWTIRTMLEWDYEDDRFFEARYEDLVEADGPALFSEILNFLGISGDGAERSLEVFRQNSLSLTNYVKLGDSHIRSGRPRQWQTSFRRRHGERFLEIMGDCLSRLGYEQDEKWIERLAE